MILTWVVLISCEKNTSQLIPSEENDLWGYKDVRGKIIIKPQFIVACDFMGDIAAVAKQDGWYFIDKSGKILSIRPFVIDNGPDYFQEGLARFKLDDKIGFLDESGRIVIAANFQYVSPFSESLAAFCVGCKEVDAGEHSLVEGGKWGFINRDGDVVIAPQFDAVKQFFKDGKAVVKLNEDWVSIDREGRILK
ncbi:WG repeat-containing protein [candidate division KSB1 bacterium]|nr:WG repeat-containing protein [candidate division KSB1 bacterium]